MATIVTGEWWMAYCGQCSVLSYLLLVSIGIQKLDAFQTFGFQFPFEFRLVIFAKLWEL